MNTVVIILGVPIPTPQGQANIVKHERIKIVEIKDGMLRLRAEDGTEIGYNTSIVVSYSADPHGSVIKPQSSIVAP